MTEIIETGSESPPIIISKKYSIDDIKSAWQSYKTQKVITYLEDGVKMFRFLDGKRLDMSGVSRAKTESVENVLSFPEYLERKWQKEK